MAAFERRSIVLVTGMSGTGKSTALAELGRRGHRVVDTDDPGSILDAETPDGPEPVWDLDRVGALLDDHRTVGCSSPVAQPQITAANWYPETRKPRLFAGLSEWAILGSNQ